MKSPLLQKITKEFQLFTSKNISIDSLKTVCLALGPYRNLTTFTASILFLHPECQVLNHAGQRIFGDDRLDFIKEYSDERFDRFCRYAIHISTKGSRGAYGGSITHSHAFDKEHRLASAFTEASLPLLKPSISTLFWKESMRTSNALRNNHVDFNKLFAANEKLRFLLPIRNPLDCAVSSIKTGHANLFPNIPTGYGVKEVSEAILDEYLWFINLKTNYPERFCFYLEYEPSREILLRLATFMELKPDSEWLTSAEKSFEIKSGYKHEDALLKNYREKVEQKFAKYPEFAAKLLAFNDPAQELIAAAAQQKTLRPDFGAPAAIS